MKIRVQPRSSQTKVVAQGDELKVYISAPPVDGEANKAVIALLSKTLGVPKSRIRIVSGESSRNKRLEIDGLTSEQILARVTSC